MNPLFKFFRHLAGAAGVLGIALFFLVFSCSQKLPTSPEVRLAAYNPGQLKVIPVQPGQTVYASIGFEGDTIAFPVGSDTAYFIIPQGAIKKEDSLINFSFKATAARSADGKLVIDFYDFGPASLVFTNDCYLVHPTRFAEGTDLPFYWFDPLTGQWQLEDLAPVINGKVTFKVTHFSTYSAPYDGDGLGSGGQQ